MTMWLAKARQEAGQWTCEAESRHYQCLGTVTQRAYENHLAIDGALYSFEPIRCVLT